MKSLPTAVLSSLAMNREELPPHKTATYVLPRWKVVYISVPKAACTSLKWMMADLQGESREHFYSTVSPETGRSMTLHRRSRWQQTPMLHQLSDNELEEISPENGWFVFAVVRHPATRLWSGWQSKFLLRDPRFVKLFPDSPWPRIPSATADVVEDFQEFVHALEAEPPHDIFKDRHFLPQVRLLSVDRTSYSRIYQTSQIPQLLDDLEKHLRPQGLEALPKLLKSNETPLRPLRSLFTQDVRDIIGRYYAADFERFEYVDSLPEHLDTDNEYAASELGEIGRLVERSERIGDLHDIAIELRNEQRRTARELAATTRRLTATTNRLRKLKRSVEAAPEPRSPARRLAGAARREVAKRLTRRGRAK